VAQISSSKLVLRPKSSYTFSSFEVLAFSSSARIRQRDHGIADSFFLAVVSLASVLQVSLPKAFLSIIDAFGFTQHVQLPTHTGGNTLDPVLESKL